MALLVLPLISPMGCLLLSHTNIHHIPNPNPSSSRPETRCSIRPAGRRCSRGDSRIRCFNPSDETRSDRQIPEANLLPILRPWNVPWDWKVTGLVMMPYLMSIILTGIVESTGLAGAQKPYSESLLMLDNTDELAIKFFMDQLLKSVVKLSILYMFVRPHRPFPDDIFSLKWRQPLDVQKGWILWAGGGLLFASFGVFIIKGFLSRLDAGQAQKEAESLVRLLPLIGCSNVSTICLLGVLGILAPICEETLYRGFLLTSLTKWFPVPVSVILSSILFTLGHQSPEKSSEIFIFGVVLGLVYSQTRNLLAPITMHACWNTYVILFLTFLQGHDIRKYLL